ncbi:RNA polymerase inhibitor [Rhodobacter phage RcTiptonus]|nr:RNA polymerase inhibitor [Rhodobacter phage RcTiptonus]
MALKQVTITETIIRTYVVEVEANDDKQAALLAEDLLVNYEECEEASLEDERVTEKVVTVVAV